ncbi:hypothetical protein M409DRAFT_67200 [Zasmidium cellare ATCC 36951]|uniref:Non-structural maintenance of chromosomes element 4 n=1 Tax=Zasmidium cellare ATCC 36951 TaxID=1080233 RepID=A0A6A6CE03_ZASCE|nr:uncharacterized protein M409DRAFT_67200 [Zasmidium cellare ATCC 36951]KAF2165335.1 hypothetical protein M409DRAFT_67200 [Zasmidium cellare ATCC 36951]
MARLNHSRTLHPARSSSNTPSPSPEPSDTSEQENRDPRAMQRDKGKGRAVDPPRRDSLPTPVSDESETARGQKRKRTEQATQSGEAQDEEDDKFTKYFDPNQNPEIRRQVKRKSRALEREFNENRDELLRGDGDGLAQTINRANNVFKNVKQTNDATLDSRLMVNVSDLAYKKSAQLVLGDKSSGIDVDDFLSKCIYFMRNGGPANAEDAGNAKQTQRRRTQRRDDDEDQDDDDDDIGGALDWELLGRHVCFPYNSRPPCPSFLLGPLSVEKKQRKQTQRTARQTKDTSRETRPEALTRADLSQSDENGLTAICARIRKHLMKHINDKSSLASQTFDSLEDLNTPEGKAFSREHRITAEGGPILFDYALHPTDFGQTVENLFYLSFLIKEGHVGLGSDSDGLPVIKERQEHAKSSNVKRHQAVFSIDMATWQGLVKVFDIREPMIPNREAEPATQVGARGWYT